MYATENVAASLIDFELEAAFASGILQSLYYYDK